MVVMWIYLKVVSLREDALLSPYLRLLRLTATREAPIELVARVRRFHGSARESFRHRSVNPVKMCHGGWRRFLRQHISMFTIVRIVESATLIAH